MASSLLLGSGAVASVTRPAVLLPRAARSLIGKATFRVWEYSGLEAGRAAGGTDQAVGRRREEALRLWIAEEEEKQGSWAALRGTKRGVALLKRGEPDEVGDQRRGQGLELHFSCAPVSCPA